MRDKEWSPGHGVGERVEIGVRQIQNDGCASQARRAWLKESSPVGQRRWREVGLGKVVRWPVEEAKLITSEATWLMVGR
jgi:hypothetical protein